MIRLLTSLALLGLALCCGHGPAVHAEGGRPAPAVPIADALRPLDPWLRNADWSVRSIAALELRKRTEPGAVFLASRMLAGETNTYALACGLKALEGRPRHDLVMEGGTGLAKVLIEHSRHSHPVVRSRAFALLRLIPPIKLGDDVARYDGWWERGQEALRHEQHRFLDKAPKTVAPSGDGGTVETTRQHDDIYEHLERIRRHGLELCIVMDHTGSMSQVIGAAKARAIALIKRIRSYIPRFRVGLVTYDDRAMLRVGLTAREETIEKAFRRVGAGGGGDIEEGVDKGIRMALTQELLGWSRGAQRVLIVVGDAPPHEGDVGGLLRAIVKARDDEMYEHAVVVHTVSTNSLAVDHFPRIARSGGGHHVTLRSAASLVDSLVLLSFGGGSQPERIKSWMAEIDMLRKQDPKPPR
jgi:Mg-chelatase subunit ChlD